VGRVWGLFDRGAHANPGASANPRLEAIEGVWRCLAFKTTGLTLGGVWHWRSPAERCICFTCGFAESEFAGDGGGNLGVGQHSWGIARFNLVDAR
jgi:hypothetical protein